jgi:hypothetical protein
MSAQYREVWVSFIPKNVQNVHEYFRVLNYGGDYDKILKEKNIVLKVLTARTFTNSLNFSVRFRGKYYSGHITPHGNFVVYLKEPK